jgi:radical SAM protein with 4Fe4S-binding SPASM domain
LQLTRTADELAALDCRVVDITGGEPFLRPDWDKLCRYLTDKSMKVAIVTNGTLLDEAVASRAEQAGVSRISVSIDGLRDTHDATRRYRVGQASAFDAAVRGIAVARRVLPISVITQVNRTNLAELPAIGKMLGELSVSRWQLQLAIPTPRVLARPSAYALAPTDLETLTAFIVAASADPSMPRIHTSDNIGYSTNAEVVLRQKATGPGLWLGCLAGIRVVAIKYDGAVLGCSLLPEEFHAGSLHDETLTTIWGDASRFAYSARFSPSHLKGNCKTCEFGQLCRAGCTTMAYFATGTTGENPYCLHRVREKLPCDI